MTITLIAVLTLAGVWVLIGLFVAAIVIAKRSGVLCLACGRWDLASRRGRICERCGHGKSTTRDSLRAAGQLLPPEAPPWRLLRR
jgi:hypothetical protein